MKFIAAFMTAATPWPIYEEDEWPHDNPKRVILAPKGQSPWYVCTWTDLGSLELPARGVDLQGQVDSIYTYSGRNNMT